MACTHPPLAAPPPLTFERDLVGRTFVGHLSGSTTVVARLLTTPGDAEYAIHHLRVPAGEQLIITKLVGRNRAQEPVYEILAAESVRLRRDQVVVVSACAQAGVGDVDLVAIAHSEASRTLRTIAVAWRASGPRAAFEPIAPSEVTCEHEGWVEPTSARP
jgi:hypothetical protein